MIYSNELIQSTLDYWGPKYAEMGEKLTEEYSREILNNLIGFFVLLAEIDQKTRMEEERKQLHSING